MTIRLCALAIFTCFAWTVVIASTAASDEALRHDRERLAAIRVSGDTTYQVDLALDFVPENLNRAIKGIIQPYLDRGYYYCQANITNVSHQNAGVVVDLNIIRGPLVTIGDLICEGLVRTKGSTARRYLGVGPGTPLSDEVITGIESRARGISFLTFTPPVLVSPRPGYGQADLHLSFHEPRPFSFEGTAGYRPDDQNGLVWTVNAAARNLFGDGRRVRVISERRDRLHNNLAVEYRQPVYVFGVSELSFDVSTRDYRNQFYEFNAGAGWQARIGDQSSAGVSVAWKRVDPVGDEPSYRRYLVNLNYRRSTVTDSLNPRRGTVFEWSLGYAHRQYRADSTAAQVSRTSLNETRARLSATGYQSIIARLIGVASATFVTLETKETLPPFSERFLFGGAGSLRGYRTDQFSARRAAYGSAEIRWRGTGGYLFGFCDLGYLSRPAKQSDGSVATNEIVRVGYGAGVQVIDRDRAVLVAFGWNPDLRFSQPQVLIRLVTGL